MSQLDWKAEYAYTAGVQAFISGFPLSHPDMGDRYFTFELMGFLSDTYDYVGQRTTGKAAGHFAISGPGWRGKLPAGVRSVQAAPTPWILITGRVLVDGPAEVPAARALQEQFRARSPGAGHSLPDLTLM